MPLMSLEGFLHFLPPCQGFSSWECVSAYTGHAVFTRSIYLRGLRWIQFYILYNFCITKEEIFGDNAKFLLIIMIEKKMSLWQLLFCGLKGAPVYCAAGLFQCKSAEHHLLTSSSREALKLASGWTIHYNKASRVIYLPPFKGFLHYYLWHLLPLV